MAVFLIKSGCSQREMVTDSYEKWSVLQAETGLTPALAGSGLQVRPRPCRADAA